MDRSCDLNVRRRKTVSKCGKTSDMYDKEGVLVCNGIVENLKEAKGIRCDFLWHISFTYSFKSVAGLSTVVFLLNITKSFCFKN